ncbi:MAG TPA: hypothetical protein VFW08_08660 [bacterium]|nr:hypothetical protein [bacterium]
MRATTAAVDTPVARVGHVEVSRFETATGPRLRLKKTGGKAEAYLDPLELEGLTRVRYKPIRVLRTKGDPSLRKTASAAGSAARLQNEFALVSVTEAKTDGETGLLVTDMNAGQSVLLSAGELEALLDARHMDFAPLIDTSDLISLPEPDIDQV